MSAPRGSHGADSTVAPPARRWLASFAVGGAILLLWEGSKAVFAIPRYMLPHVHEILGEFLREGADGTPWLLIMAHNAGYTALESVIGFALGATTGLSLAVLFARFRLLERGLLPYVMVSQTVPILAVAPMVVVVLGSLGYPPLMSKAVISMYLCFFPVAVALVKGLRSPGVMEMELLHTYAASRRDTFWKLRVPASLPFLFPSLRVGIAAGLVGAIVGELPTGAQAGLGARLLTGSYYGNTVQIWSALVMSALLGLALTGCVALAERLLTPGGKR